MRKSDKTWEHFGERDPYWGVLTCDEYRKENLSDSGKEKFFATGEDYIADILAIIQKHVDPEFRLTTACDFGCGVGRLLLPLSKRCASVLGVDVSTSMLDESRRNMKKFNRSNVRLLLGDDELSGLTEKFDLIHSFIVFQHIPVERGLKITAGLLDRLREGGVAVLHYTYHPPEYPPEGFIMRTIRKLYRALKRFSAILANGRSREPVMLMNAYPLNEILWAAQSRGINHSYVRFSDHGKKGVLLFLQKTGGIRHADPF